MKNELKIGKIDYLNCGRKENLVTLEWELKDGVFSMSGNVWNRIRSDIYCGGQIVDKIAKMFPHNKKVRRMAQIWEKYHLNDMQAGCKHQRALGWGTKKLAGGEWEGHKYESEGGCLSKPCPTCGYKYGSKWLREEIPTEIIAEIESWSPRIEAIV